jgi:hypothetical protein
MSKIFHTSRVRKSLPSSSRVKTRLVGLTLVKNSQRSTRALILSPGTHSHLNVIFSRNRRPCTRRAKTPSTASICTPSRAIVSQTPRQPSASPKSRPRTSWRPFSSSALQGLVHLIPPSSPSRLFSTALRDWAIGGPHPLNQPISRVLGHP